LAGSRKSIVHQGLESKTSTYGPGSFFFETSCKLVVRWYLPSHSITSLFAHFTSQYICESLLLIYKQGPRRILLVCIDGTQEPESEIMEFWARNGQGSLDYNWSRRVSTWPLATAQDGANSYTLRKGGQGLLSSASRMFLAITNIVAARYPTMTSADFFFPIKAARQPNYSRRDVIETARWLRKVSQSNSWLRTRQHIDLLPFEWRTHFWGLRRGNNTCGTKSSFHQRRIKFAPREFWQSAPLSRFVVRWDNNAFPLKTKWQNWLHVSW
jgi:hypothetical protein